MSAADLAFLLLASLLILASLAVVIARNPVRATALLILSFLPTAGLYILLHSSFVGILQILVYAGAILILFTFVVMMINPATTPNPEEKKGPPIFRAFIGVSLFAVILIPIIMNVSIYNAKKEVSTDFGSLNSIGEMIFSDSMNNPMTLSFELISLLILAALVVALNLARSKKRPKS